MGQLVFQATLGGQVNLVGPNTASTFNINVPAVAGNMVTTGDTSTVTNTMLASSAYTAPGTIGSGTPNTGSFTTLSGSTSVTTPIVKSASSLTLQTNGTTTAVTIDTSQNVGVGVTPSAWVSGDTVIQVKAGSGSGALWSRSNSLRVVGNTYYDGTNYKYIASDYASFMNVNQGSVGGFSWNIAPSGTAGNNATFTQAMTLDASGNLLVGTTSSTSAKIDVAQSTANYAITETHTNAGAQYFIKFVYGSTQIGSIQGNNTATSYNTSSDYRLKNSIAPMTGALEKVAALKPCTYKWNADGSDGEGFIAHELAEVIPHAVTGKKDAVEIVDVKDEEGNVIGTEEKPVYQGIDTSFLVATLTAAIQEQQALITQLQADVAALKAPQ